MTAINTNMAALRARNASLNVTAMQEKAMERLSSGKRVNAAADDAAGLSVASKMQSQLQGINMAVRNGHDGIGLIQTAEAGMETIRNMILRIRELAVQMSNGIYQNNPDRNNADLEVTALLAQIDLIAANTKFNGINLLSGSYSQDVQAGPTTPEKVRVGIGSFATTGLAIPNATVSVTGVTASLSTIGLMDTALQTLNTGMSKLGSLQNRLTYSIQNLSSASIMTEQALGRIMDADFALETSQLAKAQILSQAATAMLSQANQSKQPLLQLLQG
jgi:flagellin